MAVMVTVAHRATVAAEADITRRPMAEAAAVTAEHRTAPRVIAAVIRPVVTPPAATPEEVVILAAAVDTDNFGVVGM